MKNTVFKAVIVCTCLKVLFVNIKNTHLYHSSNVFDVTKYISLSEYLLSNTYYGLMPRVIFVLYASSSIIMSPVFNITLK